MQLEIVLNPPLPAIENLNRNATDSTGELT